jgi:hypothetical protein
MNIPNPKQLANLKTQWKPGQSGNPAGRPLGDRNKLASKFLRDLHDVWEIHGRSVLERMAKQSPAMLTRVIAHVLPKVIQHTSEGALSRLTDDQLNELISTIDRQIAARTPSSDAAGEATPVSANKLN